MRPTRMSTGRRPAVRRTLDDAGGRIHVAGLAGLIEQALDFAEAVRVPDLGVKPAHALCLAGGAQTVSRSEYVEWGDLALEFLAVGAPPQHGDLSVGCEKVRQVGRIGRAYGKQYPT